MSLVITHLFRVVLRTSSTYHSCGRAPQGGAWPHTFLPSPVARPSFDTMSANVSLFVRRLAYSRFSEPFCILPVRLRRIACDVEKCRDTARKRLEPFHAPARLDYQNLSNVGECGGLLPDHLFLLCKSPPGIHLEAPAQARMWGKIRSMCASFV